MDNPETCDQSVVPADKSGKDGSCDADTHYQLSRKNTTGPHAGTCADYNRWNDGLDECLDQDDCGEEASFACRTGQCFCGESRYDRSLNDLKPAKCDGAKIVTERNACESGAIKVVTTVVKDCATAGETCAVTNGSAACKGTPPPGG